MMDGDRRVAISYWKSESDILNWKKNVDHLAAQQKGREKWYSAYTVQVVEVQREYSHAGGAWTAAGEVGTKG